MSKKITTIVTSILILFIMTSCGGGGSGASGGPKQLTFTAVNPENSSSLDSSNLEYTMSLFLNADGDKGGLVFGPAVVSSLNVDENLYFSRIDNILDGNYILEFSLVYRTEEQEKQEVINLEDEIEGDASIDLSLITTEIGVKGADTNIDLTSMDWNDTLFDLDNDGLLNIDELLLGTDPANPDSDGDGVSDSIDAFPFSSSESFDFDGDGLGDNKDNDADNDGLTNSEESVLGTNYLDDDSDDDGLLDGIDNCPLVGNSKQKDTDDDKIGDDCDLDIDNDGLSNLEEEALGTNLFNPDSDDDGVSDILDVFPNNGSETLDNDKDGLGDNSDLDDDNDGISDADEILLGSDSKSEDSDGDGISDLVDNCIVASNPGQNDNDSDGAGDECDEDDDDDGLSDSEEKIIGNDGFITNPLISDSDGDGFTDNLDNCPLDDNITQEDSDGDDFGDACDCGSHDPKFNQLALDFPDPLVEDLNCDGVDGNKYEAIFVASDGISLAGESKIDSPTSDLQGAIDQASELGFPVFVAEGEYNLSNITLKDGVSLYGGFSPTFLDREITGDEFSTKLILADESEKSVVLSVEDFEQPISIAGFVFTNNSTQDFQTLLYIQNSSVTLSNNKFEGNADIDSETLVKVLDSTLFLNANQFYGGASYESKGLEVANSDGNLTNNIFGMGVGDHTKGMVLSNSDLVVSNNTIDAGQHSSGSAFGIVLDDSNPKILNNIFISSNDSNQASIKCSNGNPSQIAVQSNLFLRYTTTGLNYSAYVECDGTNLYTKELLEASLELSAQNNIVSAVTDVSDLSNILDVSNYYQLVSGSQAIDSGMNTSSSSDGLVLYDFLGNSRTSGSYDIGANEF